MSFFRVVTIVGALSLAACAAPGPQDGVSASEPELVRLPESSVAAGLAYAADLKSTFAALDTDRDGAVSATELSVAGSSTKIRFFDLRLVYDRAAQHMSTGSHGGHRGGGGGAAAAAPVPFAAFDERLDSAVSLFRSLDTNGDGRINASEIAGFNWIQVDPNGDESIGYYVVGAETQQSGPAVQMFWVAGLPATVQP